MEIYYKSGDNINQYQIINLIGEGRYGIAYLVEDSNKDKYVLKQLKEEMLEKSKNKLFYEGEILSHLDDDRIPEFIEKFIYKESIIYVLKYLEGRDFEVMIVEEEWQFTKDEIYNIALQLIDIIETLQHSKVVHRDIRTPNVILDKNNNLKLIDFGLARYINDDKYVKEIDYWYLADFLIHLYYTTFYIGDESFEKPWFEELDLDKEETMFLKKLMGIEKTYTNTNEIRNSLHQIISKKDRDTYSM